MGKNSARSDKGKNDLKDNLSIVFNNNDACTYYDELFIKIEKQFTDPESKYRLTPEELYIYVIVSIDLRKDGSAYTCLHMIEQNMPVKFGRTEKLNRNTIIHTLQCLEKKGVISINGELNTKNAYSMFYLRINYENFEDVEGWAGFNMVQLSVLRKIKRVEHLYIYCTIKSYDGSDVGGFMCSYKDWGEILKRSTSSVKRYIKEMTIVEGREKGSKDTDLIYTNRGNYIKGSRIRQHTNIYKTVEFNENETTTRTKNKNKEIAKKAIKENLAFGKTKDSNKDKLKTPF